MNTPSLRRDIQLVPAKHQGRQVIVVLDSLKLAGGDVVLDPAIYPLLAMLDGRHGFQDLQRITGAASIEDVTVLLGRLDELYLLDSDRYRQRKQELRKAFADEPDRQPALAGRAYSDDAAELEAHLGNLERLLPPLEESQAGKALTGLLAPHIDTGVAGSVYVDLYRRLRRKHYDRVIVLGINHQEQDGLYSVLDKGFLTPFGRIPPDRDFISALIEDLPPGVIASDNFGHKMEHSIEFQTLFLGHFLESSFSIVPVLCGSLHSIMTEGTSIMEDRRFMALYERMNRLLRAGEGSTLVVAAVDFAHVGLKFGHPDPASVMVEAALENDRTFLSHIEEGKAEDIFRHACETRDCFNVCGLPAILLFTLLMKDSRGRLLAHETYREDATGSAVTYASMVFEAEGDHVKTLVGGGDR